MKLLICTACFDLRALRIGTCRPRRCRRSRARYVDRLVAEVSGKPAVLLGIRNDSLDDALQREITDHQAKVKRTLGHELVAFAIPWSSPNAITCRPARRRSAP